MTDKPAGWAIRRARDLMGAEIPQNFQTAFARYIEHHEQPPVDPDILAVREILAAFHEVLPLTRAVLDGAYDHGREFQAALAVYRLYREATNA